MTTRKTTKEEFNKFCNSFLKYADIYGLNNWKVLFLCRRLNEDHGAAIAYSIDAMSATVSLCDEYSTDDYPRFDPVIFGKHEATHLLLAELVASLKDPEIPEKQKEREEEKVVILLSRLNIDRERKRSRLK